MATPRDGEEQFIDEFRSLVVQVQSSIENVSDRVYEVIRKTAIETSKLNSYARSVADNMGLAALQSENVRLAAQQTKIEKELENAIDANRIDFLREQLNTNQEIQESISTQIDYLLGTAAASAEAAGYKAKQLDYTQQLREVDAEIVRLEKLQSGEIENTLNLTDQEIENRKEILQLQRNSYESMQAESQLARKNEVLRSKANEIFGFDIDGMREKAEDMGTLLMSWPGIILLAAAATKKLLGGILEVSDELRASGASYAQTWELAREYVIDISDYTDRLRGDWLATGPKAAAEAAGILVSRYGDLDDLSQELVDQQLILTKSVGLSADEAAGLLMEFQKLPGYTDQSAEDLVKTTRSFASINKIAPGKLFSIVAGHTQEMAQYGARGAQSFVRAAAAATKMGVELSKIEGFQDRVLDIDTFIQDITKLRTLGMNFEDPFRLAELSQAGDIEGFVSELQSQLAGVGKSLDIQSLGRVQARALEQAFGMSLQDLQRIAAGKDLVDLDPNTAALEESAQQTENLISSVRNLLGGLDAATLAMSALTAAVIANTFAQGAGLTRGLLSKIGLGGAARGAGTVATGAGTAGTAAGGAGGAATGLARFAPGLTKVATRGVPLLAGVSSFAIDKAQGETTGKALAGGVGTGGGALAGALTGAAIGSIVPVIGTAIGGLIGSIGGSILGRKAGRGLYDAAIADTPERRMQRQTIAETTGAEQLLNKFKGLLGSGRDTERDEERAAIPSIPEPITAAIEALNQIKVDTLIVTGKMISEQMKVPERGRLDIIPNLNVPAVADNTRIENFQTVDRSVREEEKIVADNRRIENFQTVDRSERSEREIEKIIKEINPFIIQDITRSTMQMPRRPNEQSSEFSILEDISPADIEMPAPMDILPRLPTPIEMAMPAETFRVPRPEILTPPSANVQVELPEMLQTADMEELGAQISNLVTQIASQREETKETKDQPVTLDTSKLEMKMDNLISMFRDGKIAVNIDGRKAGKLIAGSFQRDYTS